MEEITMTAMDIISVKVIITTEGLSGTDMKDSNMNVNTGVGTGFMIETEIMIVTMITMILLLEGRVIK